MKRAKKRGKKKKILFKRFFGYSALTVLLGFVFIVDLNNCTGIGGDYRITGLTVNIKGVMFPIIQIATGNVVLSGYRPQEVTLTSLQFPLTRLGRRLRCGKCAYRQHTQ